jgi:microcystin-dependent protein
MATVTGLTAARMQEIEAASVVDGEVVGGNLILEKHDGSTIDAGSVLGPPGPQGPQGLSAIPGEIKLWPGDVLPAQATYGQWVWADGSVYLTADHPLAAAHIASQWRTFAGAADPGASSFRVPDLRGLVAAGLDSMPGGSAGRANRMIRAEAIVLAKTTGEEKHKLLIAELARHQHGGSINVGGGVGGSLDAAGSHVHAWSAGAPVASNQTRNLRTDGSSAYNIITGATDDVAAGNHSHGLTHLTIAGSGTIPIEGSDTPHENVQPTVFVPYIVCLDT